MSQVSPEAVAAAKNIRDRTFFWDRWRMISTGIQETAFTTFVLLIAIQQFNAGPASKAILACAFPAGMLLTPALVTLVARSHLSGAQAASRLLLAAAGCLLVPVFVPLATVFLVAMSAGMVLSSLVIPLFTQIYQDNYGASERGTLFTRAAVVRIASAAAFAYLGGWLLEQGMSANARWVLLILAVSAVFAAFCVSRFPSKRGAQAVPLNEKGKVNVWHALSYVKTDALFRRTLCSWMLMGMGMLMIVPLRVEYLANPKYSLGLTPVMVAFIMNIAPNLVRFFFSPMWGRLFDQLNFFALRVMLNGILAVSMLFFFHSRNVWMLLFATLLFGIGTAGGDVAWNLWVTKVAKPEHVGEYMSVHLLFNGIRGLIAPFLGFYGTQYLPIQWVVYLAIAFMIGGCVIIVPEARHLREKRPGKPVVANIGGGSMGS
jgi:MFS family permease